MPLVLIALFLKGCAENGPVYRPTAAEKCRSSGSVCSALRMWTKSTARSSSPSRRPMPPCTSRKNASGQHCVLTQTTKTSPGFLLILQEHRERFFLLFLSGEADASLSTELGDSITPASDAAVDDEADSAVVELLLTALLAEPLPPPPGSCEGKSFP